MYFIIFLQVSLPGHICAVVVTTLVLEGWSNQLDPKHGILEQVESIVAPDAAPWGTRVSQAVDAIMHDEVAPLAVEYI